MEKNERITCQITGIQPYGIFVQCQSYIGLIHISDVSNHYVSSVEEIFSIGDEIDAVVIEVDEENKKVKLSYKKALQIHPKIQEKTKIKIGFHSLAQMLPIWISKQHKGE